MQNVFSVASEDTGFTELVPVMAGTEDCLPGHFYGPAVRTYVLIHFVHGGSGRFKSEEGEWTLHAGECFTIFPGQVTRYEASEQDPWNYTWLAFRGTRAIDQLAAFGVTPQSPIFFRPEAGKVFEQLQGSLALDVPLMRSGYRVLSLVMMLLDVLDRPEDDPDERPGCYVRRVMDTIDKLYADNLTVDGIARSIGLDRHYLVRLFKSSTGRTIQQYLVETRMEKAKKFLLETAMPVQQVAYSSGYPDVCNFSRMFRRVYGVSPTGLRAAHMPGSRKTP